MNGSRGSHSTGRKTSPRSNPHGSRSKSWFRNPHTHPWLAYRKGRYRLFHSVRIQSGRIDSSDRLDIGFQHEVQGNPQLRITVWQPDEGQLSPIQFIGSSLSLVPK